MTIHQKKNMNDFIELRQKSAEITDLRLVMALLQWDQEVMMPAAAAPDRASQCATLSRVLHRAETAAELGGLLQRAAGRAAGAGDAERGLLRVMQRDYQRQTRLPEDFVADFARLTSESLEVWVTARQQSDFERFRPQLEKIVAMSRQQADYLGYAEHPYDALLDLHEEGLTTARVSALFAELKGPLVDLARQLAGRPQTDEFDPDRVQPPMGLEDQVRAGEELLAAIGYDFRRGRQDRSAHPFSTTLGHHDRRVTNRYRPESLEFVFSALHEGGHALYEQGIAPAHAGCHLDTGVSLGIHESQSRLWENIIGRSPTFWKNRYPRLQEIFPEQLKTVSPEDFFAGINRVRPGLIRVEADEVTYNLHVLVRFELEKALIEGSIKVAELPELWNRKYEEYLGVQVPDQARGVLQDIHWAHGSIGYFPTYTLGNLAAAQIWNAYTASEPRAGQIIESGDLSTVRLWFADKIYQHGSVYAPDELLQRICGEPLSPRPFLDYLWTKYLPPQP